MQSSSPYSMEKYATSMPDGAVLCAAQIGV